MIVAFIAHIAASVAAATGGGTAFFGAEGTVQETDPSACCIKPVLDEDFNEEATKTVAGVLSAIATAAVAVALSDAADPFWRGQEKTPPAAGELTVGEKVEASWSLPDAPTAGSPYTADVKWTYSRFTTGKTYQYSVSETQTNVHVLNNVEVTTPATIQPFKPLWVHSKFHRTDASLFKGSELYAFALFRSPDGLFFVVPMTDDGLGFDPGANDGVYAGSLDLKLAYRQLQEYGFDVHGIWRVYVFAQDVNLTKPGTPPEVAAQHIGGFFVASAITLTFDPSLPCPLTAQGTITVA
jgi:hypothetical protein